MPATCTCVATPAPAPAPTTRSTTTEPAAPASGEAMVTYRLPVTLARPIDMPMVANEMLIASILISTEWPCPSSKMLCKTVARLCFVVSLASTPPIWSFLPLRRTSKSTCSATILTNSSFIQHISSAYQRSVGLVAVSSTPLTHLCWLHTVISREHKPLPRPVLLDLESFPVAWVFSGHTSAKLVS
ncbi:hypothetical protein FRB94_014534 [Tulasnella sp. JGI-2019a]|nr:hypothetical protein FRB94_014534 [Tulasnella sp. JGI-2019a]